MHTTRRTSSLHGQAPSALDRATRWWETAYTSVTWDYPPSLAAHRDALLSRGASHSRFLRIAYLSTRDPSTACSPIVSSSSTPPSTFSPDVPPVPRPSATPRSAHPTSHLKRRHSPHSQWPKPPHYHASLLRSPLSRRKGLFRAVLAPNQAVDYFRRDILVVGATVSMSAPSLNQQRDRKRRCHVDARAWASVHGVAESVLESYEAAAGFSGWHGLGIDVMRCVERNYDDEDEREVTYRKEKSAGKKRSSDLGLEMDEEQVEEGRATWALVAQDLVGPPGVVLRWVVEKAKSEVGPQVPSSSSWRAEEIRWDPDIGSSRSGPSKSTSDSDERRPPPPSSSRQEINSDSPPAWWYAPSPHRGPPSTPHMHSFRFPPPPPVQYGVPSLQFPPWLPSGRVTSAQGHGYWYSAQPIGAPSPTSRDPNQARAFAPYSHVFASPTSAHSHHSPRYPNKPNLGRDEYQWVRDCDKETETETDHGYESATTTTDSDPPPHTPIGAATRVEAPQVHGDNDGEALGVEDDADHVVACETPGLSDPSTPVKLLRRFSSSMSSGTPGSNRDGCESSRIAVVFPSLNGSFRQGSLSNISVSPSGQGVSSQTTPVRSLTPVSPSAHLSTKASTIRPGAGGLEPSSACSASGDDPEFTHPLGSSPPTNYSPGLRKDSQGFWDSMTSMTSISPCSSSSSLPLSPSVSQPAAGWIDERTVPVAEESHESSSEAASSQFTSSAKSRSLSPGPRRVTSAGSTRSSSSQPASHSSPTTTPASGSYPSSPSPLNESSSFVSPLAPAPTLSNPTTLLPAFLTATSAKRKKTSRTREIVDRLRSSSVDAGKCGMLGMDGMGWLVGGEVDGMHGKTASSSSGSENVGEGYGDGGQASPLQSDVDAGSGLDAGKNHSGQGSKSSSSESGSSGSRGEHDGKTSGSETASSLANAGSKGVTTTTTATAANASVTPFPILSVSQTSSGANFTPNHHNRTGDGTDGLKTNVIPITPPKGTCSSGSHSQLSVGIPNGGPSPSKHPSHHPLPSAPASHPHPAVHPHPVASLAPPPPMITTVSPFQLQPVYVSFPQYHVVPTPATVPVSPVHQGPQGQLQGTWVAVYPARPPPPPHVGVHPLSAPIPEMSGMRHASW